MSDTTTDTSAIDDKKEDTSSSATSFISNIGGFLISLIVSILIVLIYFSSSGLLLFVCKLAQSNILPTEPDCAPYTNNEPKIEKIQTNIFTTFTDPEMSMKLEIPNDEKNSKYRVIDMLKKYKEKPNSSFLANYFISITESIMQFDYSFINVIMNFFNGIPEVIIVGIGPIIAGILFATMVLLNGLYFMYLWFAKMYWFFKTNTNVSGEGKPEWEDVTLISPVNWCIGFWLVILFIIFFIFGFPLLSFLPFIIVFYCSLSCLFYKGILNGKSISSFSIIKEILKHYKITIVSIISLFVVLLAFSKLGPIPGLFSILTLALVYFGVIGIDIFNPIPDTNLSPSVSYEQATKTCITKEIRKTKHGFLYNLLLGQNGGGIAKDLKKIGKNLSSK